MKISYVFARLAIAIAACTLLAAVMTASGARASDVSDADGVLHIPAYVLPESSLLDAATRATLKGYRERAKSSVPLAANCPSKEGADRTRMREIRQCWADEFYRRPVYTLLREKYPVALEPQVINGVYAEVFTPVGGVAGKNRDRVLINLHGGGFEDGSRISSHAESMPIASIGRIKVISVDYRMAPEYEFPSASEDVEIVYRELLRTYQPQNIGIYGCSAGGLLTAQVVAWLQWKGLPKPGAVGMFCGAAYWFGAGDSGRFAAARERLALDHKALNPQANPYMRHVDNNDTLAYPGQSQEILASFPPSLLIASTRDLALSSVAHTHSRLVALGVDAELHVWEGLGHGFFLSPRLPESREVHDVVVRFFDRYLGAPAKPSRVFRDKRAEALELQLNDYQERDGAALPSQCQVLFVGSSSIAFWQTLAHDMAPIPTINRGLGGSRLEDVNRWFDTIVSRYRPRAIVLYAGENDVAAGKSKEQILADFDEFLSKKRAALGHTPVYVISLKPSKLRAWQLALQTQVNEVLRKRAQAAPDLHYIDVASWMLKDGRPRDLFLSDNLHMNAEGYVLWTKAVRGALLPNDEADRQACVPVSRL